MRLLILGSTGMLGSCLLNEFIKNPNYKIVATYRDIKKLNSLKKNLNYKRVKFVKFNVSNHQNNFLKKLLNQNDIIINCLGLIKQKIKNKKDEKNAFLINAKFPKKINEYKKKNQKIYQIATDCVFLGEKGNYTEKDLHDCKDAYGLSKSKGEVKNKNFFNIRCSIIGKELNSNISLYEWLMKTPKNKIIKGFSNHFWNGVSTKIFSIILNKIIVHNVNIPNVLHLVPKDRLSKYDLLKCLIKYNKKRITLLKFKHKIKIDRTLSTNYKQLNYKIWKLSLKKQLTIREILKNYI